ncbi:anti-anti-sigma factor [Saccharothrix tamanrassetensis]|uniref:Anti-anti-sigma factor n=1 Tax=Saccharothrix tamanrassetensis TaxID=1051531 RepID=A0A841CWC8_9PSEU|nr:STAS domain-containing protein [Saccharothrix tamanrassetensis]MBB5959676.1 anti-anti-sigma factor [Saccharothrix tamanrassetensis]
MSLQVAGGGVVVSLKRAGTTSVLVVRGCVDAEAVPALREAADALVEGAGGAVVDLSDLSFFSSAAVEVLVAVSRRLAARGSRLHLVVSPVVHRVLCREGAEALFELHEFPAEAEEAAGARRDHPVLLSTYRWTAPTAPGEAAARAVTSCV